MLSRLSSGFPKPPHYHQELHMIPSTEDLVSPSSSLLFNLSILNHKFTQLQTLIAVIISPDQNLPDSSPNSIAVATTNITSVIQEIIVTATSMMITCQHMMSLPSSQGTTTTCTNNDLQHQPFDNIPQSNFADKITSPLCQTNSKTQHWFGESYDNNGNLDDQSVGRDESNEGYEIIEFDAAELLAKYTHYCSVCGKGFKRDANLRMHMRAHGDEYKNSAALSNPMKKRDNGRPKKYSCPVKGCRWNKEHAKFQPLKSMICMKNHYKRSHCPKMYVCRKCNQKQFSVTCDLRTHEKHCGDLKWQCSCGTTFSRKDKLMGHVALFVGHAPLINNGTPPSAREEQQLQIGGGSSSRR